MLGRVMPPNRSLPTVPPTRPPRAGEMIPPSSDPPARCARDMADFGAHGSAETPSAKGAGGATDAECGIRRAAAERVAVIAVLPSFVVQLVRLASAAPWYGRSP